MINKEQKFKIVSFMGLVLAVAGLLKISPIYFSVGLILMVFLMIWD